MDNNQIINILTIVLGIMLSILVILSVIFIVLKLKSRQPKQKKDVNKVKSTGSSTQNYNKQSVFDFMEFDKIEDNMIVQKDGKRYLMVIECQGINFDLMSGLEKNSVEQGFLQFLNTLRYPIQIYVQTRTVNLSNSIDTYKERVDEISKQYANKQMEYNQKVRSGQYSSKDLEKDKYDLVRQKNLYEYGIDIVNNTERMSLNKNILSKHYYIIISHYSDDSTDSNFSKDEISNRAFSELYTKAQAIISSLGVCGINSKILDSVKLAELLYVAYNRDQSEILNLRRALNAGYEDVYSTAPDVLDKRMKELDLKIEQDAINRASEVILDTLEENEKQKKIKRIENDLDNLIDQMAVALIEENRTSIGNEVADKAINKIEDNKEETKEGGEENVKKTKTTRKKSATI